MLFRITFLLILGILGCTPVKCQMEPALSAESGISEESISLAQELRDWNAYQDSLRAVLLASKPHEYLKGTLLEELYIRDLVSPSAEALHFKLPFDLHGFDCGAPDCYTTELEFSFPQKDTLAFPDQFSFTLYEYGCVEKELKETGSMKLEELTSDFVTYYSKELRSTLLIVGLDTRKEYVYFFTETAPGLINGQQVNELLNGIINGEDMKMSDPYRMTHMLTLEYERFLER